MADEEKEYAFCGLCRKNHNQGRKHIYSKKHKTNLDNILLKFGKKVDEVKKHLKKPSVEDGELEPGAKFWCHFCQENKNKHVSDGEISIYYGGVFEHFASQEHHKNLHKFWREHGAEKDKKNKFLIDKDQYASFKEGVDKALKEHEVKMETKHQRERERIKEMEVRQNLARLQPPEIQSQHIVYKTVKNEYGILQNPTGWHEGCRVWGGGIFKYRQDSDQWFPWKMDMDDGLPGSSNVFVNSLSTGVRTDTAYSEDLTCIKQPELKPGEGNVHSGATPPWLRDDTDESNETTVTKKEIGPSLDDFKKHVKRMKKVPQNPNRVGANFDRDKETDDDWLPSFGRVWNQGPRWQSRHEYRNESGRKKKRQ